MDAVVRTPPARTYTAADMRAAIVRALDKAERAVAAIATERCETCGHPRNGHPYRHMFVGRASDPVAPIRTLAADPAAIDALMEPGG